MEYKEIEGRDAWATIRGFVYQVDLTILKWIELETDSLLELERGEDIDTITKNLNNEEVLRELGQVKHRDTNVTLNTSGVFEIFLNFFEHIKNNPELKLSFSYITNTEYGVERPSLFSDGTSGITAWIELRKSSFNYKTEKRFAILQNYLIKRIESETLENEDGIEGTLLERQNLLESFRTYVKNPDHFSNFIKSFEWRLNQGSHEEISEKIKNALIQKGYIKKTEVVDKTYQRLFVFVFKLLSKHGLKQLYKSQLEEELSHLELSEDDSKMLVFVQQMITRLERRMSALESTVTEHSDQIDFIQKKLQLSGEATNTFFTYQLSSITSSPPELIVNGSLRKEKVKTICSILTSCKWLNFQGINGCGKSQLAILVAQTFQNVYWLDLRSFINEPDKCIMYLSTFLSEISSCQIGESKIEWINAVINSLPNDSILVLNDIPSFAGNEGLYELLTSIAIRLEQDNCRLLTTSNHKVPSRFSAQIANNDFIEYYDYDFNEFEVIEYLNNSSAPDYVLKNAFLIYAVSSGNPRLVTAIIYHLKSENWGEDSSENIKKILNEEITSEILNNEQQSIQKLLTDEKTKELLYRLSLIPWGFTNLQVSAVSRVEEQINHANEKLRSIVNLWIQEVATKVYQISPLIKGIGEDNLLPETKKGVYIAVADSLIIDKTIDPLIGSRSVSFYLKGEEYNKAGNLLLASYQSIKNVKTAKALSKWGLLHYWSNQSIPKSMNLLLRVYIRTEQIRLYSLLSEDINFLLFDLLQLSNDKEITKNDRFLLEIFLVGNPVASNIGDFWNHFDYIIDSWDKVDEEYKELLNIQFLSSLLWASISKIKSSDDLTHWINGVEFIESMTSSDFFDWEHAQTAITVVSDIILNEQSYLPVDQRDLSIIERNLIFLSDYFQDRNNERLESVVIKDLIVLEFDGYKRKGKAEELAVNSLIRFSDPIAQYLILEKLGKLLYKNEVFTKGINEVHTKGREWLLKAVEIGAEDQLNIIDTLIYAAASVSQESNNSSLVLCKKAENIALNRPDLTELNLINVFGELAISFWLNGDLQKAFEYFEKVVNNLFQIKPVHFGKDWIRQFMLTGNCLGYIAAIENDKKQLKTEGENATHTKPFQGIYFLVSNDLSSLYKKKNDPLICVNMAMIADAANKIEKTHEWSMKAFDLSRKEPNQSAFFMISTVCAPYSIINFKVNEALESQLLAAAISNYFDGKIENKEEEYGNLDLEKLYSDKPSVTWTEAEITVTGFGIIPLLIKLMNFVLKEDEKKEDHDLQFFSALDNYTSDASDKKYWEEMTTLCRHIMDDSISVSELVSRADYYGKKDIRHLRTICMIGVIFLAETNEITIQNLIHAIPYTSNLYSNNRSVIKFVLLPFVQNRSVEAIKNTFMGTRVELAEIIDSINTVKINDSNALQLALQIAVEAIDAEVIPQRKAWLYDFDNTIS